MDTSNYHIRQMRASDSQALARLEDNTADTGLVGFKTSYQYDFYAIQQALRTNFAGIVVETADQKDLVGVGLMSFGECQVVGEVLPFAYFGGLGVHEAHRRRGIASAVAAKRVELAHQHIGSKGVIIAGVQGGNEGSLKTAMKWANQKFEGRSGLIFARTTSKPPRPINGILVRPASEQDLEEITDRQNAFFHTTNLYPPKIPEQLSKWLVERPFGHTINQYYVAVDRDQNLLAGIGITREGCLITSHIVRMPRFLRAVNFFLRLVPQNGENKRLNSHWFWFQPGQEAAGRYLWESIRWLERENATTCTLFYDRVGPISQVVSPSKLLPSSGGYILVNSPVNLPEDKPIYFNNMMV